MLTDLIYSKDSRIKNGLVNFTETEQQKLQSTRKMLTTCEQSCEVFPRGGSKYVVFQTAPPVPKKWTGTLVHRKTDGTTITVFETETVVKKTDGTMLIYHRKPTMRGAMELSQTGQYVRFYGDGSVEHSLKGEVYNWGPDAPFAGSDNYYATCNCRECMGQTSYDDYDEPYLNKGDAWSRVGGTGLR